MISAKNYAAHAERAMREWGSTMRDYPHKDSDVIATQILADVIKDSVHFAIPDDGIIFGDNLKGLVGVQARLPYRSITVEYYCNEKQVIDPRAPFHSPRRLVVAIECNRSTFDLMMKLPNYPNRHHPMENLSDDIGIYITVVNEIDGRWIPCAVGMMIPITWDLATESNFDPLVPSDSGVFLTGVPVVFLPGVYKLRESAVGDKMAMREGIHDITSEIRALLELCEALTCSNVSTENLQEGNARINERRVREGKLPIYETKVLTIEVPREQTRASSHLHTDRNSPRQHLRRGHIRMLKDRRIWVNSCVVGRPEHGRIDKSYAVIGS